jgi:protein required for transport of RNA pol II
VLQTLSDFLQSDTAPWFRSIISGHLSRVPLREDGVLQTIVFIAAQFAPSLGQNDQPPSLSGPPITIQAIMQISKLLSSVPQSMDPLTYFHNIAPKLLVLMDGNDPDLKKTAAYVVGNGILGKRAYGVPGTVGHSIFVEPAFKAITATLDASSRKWLKSSINLNKDECLCDTAQLEDGILVSESELLVALERITLLTLQQPDPGLVKRLIHPILLPLWGLACYAEEQGNSGWYVKVLSLLQTYFSISAGTHPLIKIIENLLWNGGPSWTYTRGPTGGISLTERSSAELDFIQLVGSLDRRANSFTRLLGSDPQSEERTCDVFLYVSETWLGAAPNSDSSIQLNISRHEAESKLIAKKLVSTKIAEKLLESFQDTLSRHPLRVLGLVKQLIESESDYCRNANERKKSEGPSLASLVNIVAHEDTGISMESNRVDSAESLSASFSLLSTILASPGFFMSEDLRPMLEGIKTQLSQLVPYLPAALSQAGTTTAMLLEIHLSSLDGKQESKSTSLPTADLDIHRQALRNISTSLPPVQAEGLALLSNLIIKSSPVLDIPSTLSLLLSLVTEPSTTKAAATEEFIYLPAIKSLGLLASKHPRTVIKTLVDLYADRNEERSINQRLKIGESLLRTIQDLGGEALALVDEAAKLIGEGMISVAGRRARKSKAQKARKLQLDQERRKREREERESVMPPGWKISAPASLKDEFEASSSSPSSLFFDYDDPDAEKPEQAAVSADILSSWAAGAAGDLEPDDLRIRASAISILGTAVQTNLMALGPSIASSTVDLALATLTHEPGPESAILRRASVVLLLDVLKAIDSAHETRRSGDIGFGFSFIADGNASTDVNETYGPTTIGNIPTMLRTLNFVESQETDDIVRGHIRVLIESLEAWMERSLLWGIGSYRGGKRLELGKRIAGLNIDPLACEDNQRKPKIEEIE